MLNLLLADDEFGFTGGDMFTCMYCGSDDGHDEVVTTDDPKMGSEEVWFCCHPCRDAGKPCETFHPVPEGQTL